METYNIYINDELACGFYTYSKFKQALIAILRDYPIEAVKTNIPNSH